MKDMRDLVRETTVSYEQLVYILALWVFDKSEYSFEKKLGERAAFNHMEINWHGHVSEVLRKLGFMESLHMHDAFIDEWRPWQPLVVSKNTKNVPQCELISAIVYMAQCTKLQQPYTTEAEVIDITPFELNESETFMVGHDELSSIVAKLISTVVVKLGLASHIDEHGVPSVSEIYINGPTGNHPISPFNYIAGINWNTDVFPSCECPSKWYEHLNGCRCPNFSKETKNIIRSEDTRWINTPPKLTE